MREQEVKNIGEQAEWKPEKIGKEEINGKIISSPSCQSLFYTEMTLTRLSITTKSEKKCTHSTSNTT